MLALSACSELDKGACELEYGARELAYGARELDYGARELEHGARALELWSTRIGLRDSASYVVEVFGTLFSL